MKIINKILFLSIVSGVVLLLSACSNTKDITMFQEPTASYNQFQVPPNIPEHQIKAFDHLYLSILTLDPEVNQQFNPNMGGNGLTSGTQQMYGTSVGQYLNGYRVSEKGTITIPILGEIEVAGLTLQEAQNHLATIAQEYLKEPNVELKFLNYKINILGEINRPGIYYNYEGSINILDAIGMASGPTNYANIKEVLVKRYNNEGIKTFNIDLTDNSIFSSEAFYLYPNDMIYLPPSKLKRQSENANTYSQILSTISTLLVAVTLVVNL